MAKLTEGYMPLRQGDVSKCPDLAMCTEGILATKQDRGKIAPTEVVRSSLWPWRLAACGGSEPAERPRRQTKSRPQVAE